MEHKTAVNHKWEIGHEVVINFGFATGILGTIQKCTSVYQWFTKPWGHDKLVPAYAVSFFSPKHNRQVVCSYRELDLI